MGRRCDWGEPRPAFPWRAAFIRAGQAASLPPPHERANGQAGGPAAISTRPQCRRRASPGPLAGCLHPLCQDESLPSPSPPICISAAPLTSEPADRRARPPAIPLDRIADGEASPAVPLAGNLHPRCHAESLPPPSPPKPHPCCPPHERPAGGPPAIPARPEGRRRANPAGPPGGLPPSTLPSRIPAALPRASPRAGGRGQRRSRSIGMQTMSERSCQSWMRP
jgi:hypothetical protein